MDNIVHNAARLFMRLCRPITDQLDRIERTLNTMSTNQADLDSEITQIETNQATEEADALKFQTDLTAKIAELQAQVAAGAVDLQPELDRLKAIAAKQTADDAAVNAADAALNPAPAPAPNGG